jgi:hypothetical protein
MANEFAPEIWQRQFRVEPDKNEGRSEVAILRAKHGDSLPIFAES